MKGAGKNNAQSFEWMRKWYQVVAISTLIATPLFLLLGFIFFSHSTSYVPDTYSWHSSIVQDISNNGGACMLFLGSFWCLFTGMFVYEINEWEFKRRQKV